MILDLEGRDKQGPIHLHVEVENQFDTPGTWLKGNLHCHVAGMGEPSEVCRHYRDLGLDFLTSSDYYHVTPMPESTEEFVTLQGAEMAGSGRAHIISTGLQEDLDQLDGSLEDIPRLVRDVEAQGGLAILAHATWSGFEWEELLQVARSGIAGLEVSNRTTWRINGKGRSEALWQMLLDRGIHLAAIGVDDSHSFEERVTGRTWTGALVERATPDGVLGAIRSCRTYASEGPVLRSVRFEEGGLISVACSPCMSCHYMSRGGGLRSIHADEPSERFEVDLSVEGYRLQGWLSVCLEDASGRRAWSSAIRVENRITTLY